MRTNESQLKIMGKLEHLVYAPEISKNPYHSPIELEHGSDVEVAPFEAVRFVNTSNVELKMILEVTAKLPGEPIEIILPKGTRIENLRRRSGKKLSERPVEPVIGTGQEGIPHEV